MDLFEYADLEAHRDLDETPDDSPVPAAAAAPMNPKPPSPGGSSAAAPDLREAVTTLADALRAVEVLPGVTPGRDAVEHKRAGARDRGVDPAGMGTPGAQQARRGPQGLVHDGQRRVCTPIGIGRQVPASRSKQIRSDSVSRARP